MTTLVGPLPLIHFADGSRQPYDVPRNTMDIRYAACTDHHPACDCREALLNEDIGEWRAERLEIQAAFLSELQDHATWPGFGSDRDSKFNVCSCTGCRIARRLWFARSSIDTEQDRRACRPPQPEDQTEDVPF